MSSLTRLGRECLPELLLLRPPLGTKDINVRYQKLYIRCIWYIAILVKFTTNFPHALSSTPAWSWLSGIINRAKPANWPKTLTALWPNSDSIPCFQFCQVFLMCSAHWHCEKSWDQNTFGALIVIILGILAQSFHLRRCPQCPTWDCRCFRAWWTWFLRLNRLHWCSKYVFCVVCAVVKSPMNLQINVCT